jgi:protein-disulfide isomerase
MRNLNSVNCYFKRSFIASCFFFTIRAASQPFKNRIETFREHIDSPIQNQLTTQNQQIKPFLQVPTIASEENTVRVFFSPNCPYSASYFDFFVNLANTLPQEIRYELSALPNTKDSAAYALTYLAVRRFYPNNLKQFVQNSFKLFQNQGLSSKNWSVLQRLGTMSRIPVNLPAFVLVNKSILSKDLTELIDLCRSLRVTNTPCVAVDGTYTVTPEFVPGADPGMFNQLVNSIISMSIGA